MMGKKKINFTNENVPIKNKKLPAKTALYFDCFFWCASCQSPSGTGKSFIVVSR